MSCWTATVCVRVPRAGESNIPPASAGPFAETKELVAGYTIIQVKTKDEAIEWANRFPNPHLEDGSIEIRQLFELEDFGESEAIDRFRDIGVGIGQ